MSNIVMDYLGFSYATGEKLPFEDGEVTKELDIGLFIYAYIDMAVRVYNTSMKNLIFPELKAIRLTKAKKQLESNGDLLMRVFVRIIRSKIHDENLQGYLKFLVETHENDLEKIAAECIAYIIASKSNA